MKDLEVFATAKLAEEGVKIPLTDVEGNETKHWIKIKSTDSISFKKSMQNPLPRGSNQVSGKLKIFKKNYSKKCLNFIHRNCG